MNCSERSPERRPFAWAIAIVVVLSAGGGTKGDEPLRLTTDGTLKLAPVFIDKGNEIVFATHEAPNLVAIVCSKLSDGSRRRLHPTVVNHQFDPAFSRDGRLHAYARSATSPQTVLVIQDTQDKKESVFRPRESARDRAESVVCARRLVRRVQPVRYRRPSNQLRQLTWTGRQAIDRCSRHERLAGVFARLLERSRSGRAEPAISRSL